MLTQKNDILPFEDTVQIEKLLQKHDSSLFFFSSHTKKRPNNLVLGKSRLDFTFSNQQILTYHFFLSMGFKNFCFGQYVII